MKPRTIISLIVVAAVAFLAMKRHTFNFGPQPTAFSAEAMSNALEGVDGNSTTVQEVLNQFKGETVVIDVWASWCSDCIKGLPKVVKMQEATAGKKIKYLFLSVDDDKKRWQRAIKKHQIKGTHYLVDGGWKSDFGNFLKLDWIPRYVVVNPEGDVALFKATSADDPAILEAAR